MVKVLLIMTDGLRPDALKKGFTPNIDRLYQHGSYSYHARSVMPSITLPCHMSIFHSVPPSRHGIISNTWTPMARPLPGIIEQLSGLYTAFFYSWEPLKNLNTPETLNFSYFYHANSKDYLSFDRRITRVAIETIQHDAPDFAFVYYYSIDMAGHDFSWMSDNYLRVASEVDALIGALLDSLPDDYVVILLSDHGGHERSHGTDLPEDMIIPIVFAGENIKQGYDIQKPISLLDVAPTVVHLLGVKPYHDWEGTVPEEIFI